MTREQAEEIVEALESWLSVREDKMAYPQTRYEALQDLLRALQKVGD